MNYRQLIADSWHYTQSHKKLIYWFGVLPSIFTTTVGIATLAYQYFSFKNSYLFDDSPVSFAGQIFSIVWEFLQSHTSVILPLIIVGSVLAIIYFLFPTLARAGAIQVIARNRNGQKAGVGAGFKHGMMSFLRLFEYHILIKTFSFFTILTWMSFLIRNLSPGILPILLSIFGMFLLISIFLTLLFTFTDFFIVIDGMGVFESMKKSSKLVIENWRHTVLITILMIIIGVRIFIQAVLVFLIPGLIGLFSGYIATVAVPVTGIIVGGVLGVLSLLLSAYLNGIVDIFSYTVWTFAFLDLTEKKELSARDKEVEQPQLNARDTID